MTSTVFTGAEIQEYVLLLVREARQKSIYSIYLVTLLRLGIPLCASAYREIIGMLATSRNGFAKRGRTV
jgi:hypothetical protein